MSNKTGQAAVAMAREKKAARAKTFYGLIDELKEKVREVSYAANSIEDAGLLHETLMEAASLVDEKICRLDD